MVLVMLVVQERDWCGQRLEKLVVVLVLVLDFHNMYHHFRCIHCLRNLMMTRWSVTGVVVVVLVDVVNVVMVVVRGLVGVREGDCCRQERLVLVV